jgi:hypothetical protein
VREPGVFNLPFRGLVIGFLILSKSGAQDMDFFFELVFKGSMVSFVGMDGVMSWHRLGNTD